MSFGIGVIGLGVWGCHSLEQILGRTGNASVTAVNASERWGETWLQGDPGKEGRRAAAEFGAVFHSDWRAVIHDPAVDIVSVMVCPREKAEVIQTALEAGKTVVTDKPLAFTAEEAGRLCRAEAVSAGRGFMLAGYHLRPAVARLIETVRSGRLGRIKAVSVRLCFTGGVFPGFTPTRRWRRDVPSGELTTIGSHALVTLLRLLPVPVRSIYALTRNYFYDSYRRVGAEDWAELNLQFENDAVGNVLVARLPHRVPDEDIAIDVTGTTGYARLDGGRLTVWPGEEVVVADSTGAAVLEDTFRRFFAALCSGAPMPTTFRDGYRLQALLEAALHSAREKAVVRVGDPG
ncbi:MAG: Gfo/Idh/MocA family oxidoreductase [Kiritimatiellaeota bacterium]|nr:Gfo/Idh/MocA family oxidoreductase [Kiritimatiellota bacterium]